ncbi:glycine--tRNA ligase subunit beta [Lederbergia citrea]|uniref:Glycine--tRNA ligase beta subunit n=1 Tax=Lederbergia citrea TaxID=2833581 RepID=A0A942UR32_9BACI|nr:glycine--tRNA ligase subunit beta [Lederbergia citrea]MBS4222469.1 glycine--tRNA ligase subunit beta [Lederbergia citrea]
MNKRDLLLEIGLEEMPARFIKDAMNALGDKLQSWLKEKKIGFDEIKLYSTPRRLAILVHCVEESQQDAEEEAKGPTKKIALDSDGNWSKAAIGFTKSNGMSVEDIYFKEIKGIEYVHVKKFIKGETTLQLLPELGDLIASLHFPNSMRWGSLNIRYVRPIRWIVALFGNEQIPFSVAEVQAGKKTRGHRFLGEEMKIIDPADYEKVLLGQYVIADFAERKQAVQEQIEKLGEEKNWDIPVDEVLLEEVVNLVEYPTVFFGTFNEEFLKLPEEVLITSMKEHQRYFPVKDKQGALLPYFVAVRNGDHRHIETVARGNEKVLRARLADADFFYKEDQKMPIEEAVKKLDAIVYHEKMGTLAEKVSRIRKIAGNLCDELALSEEAKAWADRAAEISKFDLVTNMVNEFPELQGIMGEKYALQQGEHFEVAQAINQHYQPRHAEDTVPSSTVGAIVSIADKLDSIVSAFAIGLIPTGSQDPYALRRQAAGIIQIMLEKEWDISLESLLKKTIIIIKDDEQQVDKDLYQKLESFFKLRLKHLLQEKGIRYDIVEAVLGGDFNDVADIVNRAETLQSKKDDSEFKLIIESLSRVLNIAGKAEKGIDIDPSLFENEYEKNLYQLWEQLKETYHSSSNSEARFSALSSLQPAISAYFDHTMVMADQEIVKNNRLAQMAKLAELIGAYASMNEILVK